MAHQHKGKSSEHFLNKDNILRELNIIEGQTIVDAGCGNGYMAKAFSGMLNNRGKVFAIDPDKNAIDRLKNEVKGTNIEIIEADITQPIPVKESSVDLIYLSTVFHGFSETQIDGFQKEAKRLLKSGGRLAVIEIKKQNMPFGPPMEIRFSPEELKQKMDLVPVNLVEVGEYFYMQIFENR